MTGLKLNWDKSLILPGDPNAVQAADPSLPLRWVETIEYLGVHISPLTYIRNIGGEMAQGLPGGRSVFFFFRFGRQHD